MKSNRTVAITLSYLIVVVYYLSLSLSLSHTLQLNLDSLTSHRRTAVQVLPVLRYRYVRVRYVQGTGPMPHIFLILRGVIWEGKNSCSLFCTESLWDWVFSHIFGTFFFLSENVRAKLNPIEIPYKITNTNFYRLKSHLSESEICGA